MWFASFCFVKTLNRNTYDCCQMKITYVTGKFDAQANNVNELQTQTTTYRLCSLTKKNCIFLQSKTWYAYTHILQIDSSQLLLSYLKSSFFMYISFLLWVALTKCIMIVCSTLEYIEATSNKQIYILSIKCERKKIMLHRIRLFIDISKIYFVRIHTYKYTFLPFPHPIIPFLRYVFIIIAF